ncbi:MAG: DUF177 domain-containing protein [Clostridia bacterium]|nr:DUF177 domain-containing protein [Clostridia bacterium]
MPEHPFLSPDGALLDLKNLFNGRETKVRFTTAFPLGEGIGSVEFAGDVQVVGTVTDYSGVLQFEAEFAVEYRTVCDRCLKDVQRILKFSLDRPVTKVFREQDEEETVFAQNDVIDLAELALIGVCENLPMKHLCSEDCKGLCLYCGTDLNVATCSCKAPPDPRLAGLLEFFHE